MRYITPDDSGGGLRALSEGVKTIILSSAEVATFASSMSASSFTTRGTSDSVDVPHEVQHGVELTGTHRMVPAGTGGYHSGVAFRG